MSFGRKQPPPSRRRCEREEVSLAGSAIAVTRSRSVMVRDLSQTGAGIGARDLPTVGEDVLMILGSFDRMARIAWRCGDRAGIRFDQALLVNEIEQIKQEADWSAVAGWER